MLTIRGEKKFDRSEGEEKEGFTLSNTRMLTPIGTALLGLLVNVCDKEKGMRQLTIIAVSG